MIANLVNIGILDLVRKHVEGCVKVVEHTHDLGGSGDVSVSGAVVSEAHDTLKGGTDQRKCHVSIVYLLIDIAEKRSWLLLVLWFQCQTVYVKARHASREGGRCLRSKKDVVVLHT